MTDIYYIEDDRQIGELVKEYLEKRGCQVSVFQTVAEAKEALGRRVPELILADWNMPDGRGDELCRWVRGRWRALPFIFLTVRGDSKDIVSGLDYGADDYVVKPFELKVLHSRICALLRRSGSGEEGPLTCENIFMDRKRMAVFCGDREVNLSQTEYEILRVLMENKGRTVTRQRLLEQIWDQNGNYVNDNTLTVAMKRLREKLGKPAGLKTIRSFGYRMEDLT